MTEHRRHGRKMTMRENLLDDLEFWPEGRAEVIRLYAIEGGFRREERWRSLAHDLRTYAQHARFCSFNPTYPEVAEPPCDCEFDAVLDRYDRLSAE